MTAIESPSNPLVRQIARSLEEKTHLLLEGEKTILDAVAAGASLDHVLHDQSVRPGRLAVLTATRPRLVSRAVLERLADSHTPQHLIAVARRRDVPTCATRLPLQGWSITKVAHRAGYGTTRAVFRSFREATGLT